MEAVHHNIEADTLTGKMEAAGFEPASRNVSKQASTCLVILLNLAGLNAG